MPEYSSTGLSIEESDFDMSGYKKIHRQGCRDLQDEEIIMSARPVTSIDELLEALDGYASAESREDLKVGRFLAPCARAKISELSH